MFLLHGLAVNQLCLILYLSKTAFSFFFYLIILFIYFWLCWVSVAVKVFSLVAASGSYSLVKKTKDLNHHFTKEDVKKANEHLKSCSVSLVSRKSK